MYNQTKVQAILVLIAIVSVVFGDRMVALAAILTYALLDYITARHYRDAFSRELMTNTLWWSGLTAYLMKKPEPKGQSNERLTFAQGVLRGLEISGDKHYTYILPNGQDPNKPNTVILQRKVELTPGEVHEIPVYTVTPNGAKPTGKALAGAARTEVPEQRQLL